MRYHASRGRRVSFKLHYKNHQGSQGTAENAEARIFSIGSRWHTPWRAYLEAIPTESTNFWVYLGEGGAVKYTLDKLDYATLGKLTQISTTNVIQFPDGSVDVFGQTFTFGGVTRHFLTRRDDFYGNAMSFQYLTNNGTIRLDKILDVDNRSTTFEYAKAGSYSNAVTKVIGPHGLTNILQYDSSGRLTNITDSVGLRSQMQYDASNVTALITPYGTTTFNYFTTTNQMDAIKVTELGVRNHFYLYYAQVDGGKVPANHSAYLATTTNGSIFSISNSFDHLQSDKRNSFYWGPRQYESLSDNIRTNLTGGTFTVANLTSTDYLRAGMNHWLKQTGSTNPGVTLSFRRDASPDGTTQGQLTWNDFAGKPSGAPDEEGTMPAPRFVAWKLPNGESRFTYSELNSLGYPTLTAETYTAPDNTCQLRTNKFEYAANNIDLTRHIQVIGSTSRYVSSNVFNSAHNVLTNLNALGDKTTFTYNAKQQPLAVTTAAGLTLNKVYETSGTWSNFLAKIIQVEINNTNSYAYSNGYVFTHTDPNGLTRTTLGDGLGRVTQTLFPDGTSNTWTYTNLHPVQAADRLGQTTTTTHDAFGQLTQVVDPASRTTSYSYCNCGSLDAVTDGMGKTTSFIYDQQGRRCVTVLAGGGAVTNHFDLLGRITNVMDTAGSGVTNYHNNQGRISSMNTSFGPQFMVTYDIEDLSTNTVDANTVTNRFAYDDLGRMTRRTDGHGQIETFTYSARGLTAHTNQLGQYTCYSYDVAGRKLTETNANGEITTYTYDAAGSLRVLKDGKGQQTKWGYDSYGRVTSKTNAAGAEILRYSYDASGRLTNRWSLAKGNTRFVYDPSGNLITVDYPASQDISMQYDTNSRLTNMVDAAGNTAFAYTDFGALLSEDGPWADDTLSYSYTTNRLHSKLSLLQPNASRWEQTYDYDSANRLTGVASPAGTFSYVYDPTGHLQVCKLALPNGSYITNTYDVLRRLTNTSLKNSGGTVLNSHAYTYDAASRRTRQTRTDGSYADYGYDNIGQLKTAGAKESGGSTTRWHEQMGYTYDAAGNLSYRTNNTLLQIFNVDSQNQLTSSSRSSTYTVAGTTWGPATNVTVADNGNSPVTALRYADNTFARTNVTLLNGTNTFTGVALDSSGRADTNTTTAYLPSSLSFAHDGNGNLITNGTRILQYDDENQLICITEPSAWMSTNIYDGKKRRRIRREYTWQSSAWLLSTEVRYVYDDQLVVQERDGLNMPSVSYTRGRDLSGSLGGAGGIGGLLARTENWRLTSESSGSAHSYYQADANGNVTTVVDTNQIVMARYLFDPFGNTLSANGPMAEANLYRFSSKELHLSSGLVYYLYRFYDPNLQRWPNQDPIQKGVNTYQFVRNSPTRGVDPLGLDFRDALGDIWNWWQDRNFGAPGSRCRLEYSCILSSEGQPVRDAWWGVNLPLPDGDWIEVVWAETWRRDCWYDCTLTKKSGCACPPGDIGEARRVHNVQYERFWGPANGKFAPCPNPTTIVFVR